MNKLIVLTYTFPFRVVGENFFESELEGIAKKFDEVYIITTLCKKKNPEIKKVLPKNCKAFSIERGSVYIELLLGAIKLPFCPFFYRELKEIKKQNRKFLPALKRLFCYSSYYLGICSRLPKVVKKMELKKEDNIVIFSYWLSYFSEAALKLKKLLKREDIKVYSRAHGSADIINLVTPNDFYPFQKNALEKLDKVYVISNRGGDYLKSLSPRPENVESVYIGAYGHSEYIERRRKPFTVMTCANLFVNKRIGIVAEAIKILTEKIPDIAWVHFGDGPLKHQIEEKIKPISQRVILKGNQPHDVLLDYLKSGEASVFVSASASEGLPVSIMEALGFSLPVVATDVGATGEAVITDKTGILVPADVTAEDIADSILKIYNMPLEEYSSLCRGAFEHWQEVFDQKKTAEILADGLAK